MTRRRLAMTVLLGIAFGTPLAHAQNDAMKAAVITQQRHVTAPSQTDLQRRLNRKLFELARQFWLSARTEGLKFENVVENIGLLNASREEFGLPLQVIRREDTDEFAITSRVGEALPRAWVSLSGTSPENGIDLTAIDGAIVTGPVLTPDGGVDLACRYRVVFANEGEHDGRGHDDYAHDYSCIDFLTGEADAEVIADLKRWAADLVRRTGQ
jgi:hypothetical protein